jgi:hypothetical protein
MAKKEIPAKTDDLESWPGGLNINLKRVMKGTGRTLGETLSAHIKEELDKEMGNQSKLLTNIKKWQRQFKGKKKSKSTPWANASNIAVPITRSNVENVFVRLMDNIFNRRKPVIVKAKKPELMEVARETETALEWLLTNVIKLREKLFSPLLQQLKIGTAIVYLAWEEERRTIYRWAEDSDPKEMKRYKVAGGTGEAVKDTQTIYSGPNIYPIPREDFIISSDATTIKDAYMVGFRKAYRKEEMELRAKRGVWLKDEVAKILSPDKPTENEETRADNQGKELEKTDSSKPYEFWTICITYDVDGDDEPDDIMVTIHRETGTIVRAIYSPTFTGQRPFVRLVCNPVEYAFDGEGFCEVLKQLQEEIDSLHNQRLDRGSMINSMMTITQEGSGLENFKVELGKNYVCAGDVNDVFKEIKFSDNYPSTYAEEDRLIALADRVSGNTPAIQGISTAERPVFKDTQAMIGEGNKKFDAMSDNLIAGLTEIFYQLLELYSQYDPMIRYQVIENGKPKDRSLTLPITMIRDGLDITMSASSKVTSQEARREINNNIYMMQSDYSTKMASVMQALTSPMVPVQFKKFLLAACKANAKLFEDVMLDSERPDAEELSLNIEKILTPQEIQQLLAPPPLPSPPVLSKPGAPTGGPGSQPGEGGGIVPPGKPQGMG